MHDKANKQAIRTCPYSPDNKLYSVHSRLFHFFSGIVKYKYTLSLFVMFHTVEIPDIFGIW